MPIVVCWQLWLDHCGLISPKYVHDIPLPTSTYVKVVHPNISSLWWRWDFPGTEHKLLKLHPHTSLYLSVHLCSYISVPAGRRPTTVQFAHLHSLQIYNIPLTLRWLSFTGNFFLRFWDYYHLTYNYLLFSLVSEMTNHSIVMFRRLQASKIWFVCTKVCVFVPICKNFKSCIINFVINLARIFLLIATIDHLRTE